MYSIVQKRSLSTSPSSKINNVKSWGTQASSCTGMAPECSSWRFLSHHQAPISCFYSRAKSLKKSPGSLLRGCSPRAQAGACPVGQPETEPGPSCTWLCPQASLPRGSFLNSNQTIQSDTSCAQPQARDRLQRNTGKLLRSLKLSMCLNALLHQYIQC